MSEPIDQTLNIPRQQVTGSSTIRSVGHDAGSGHLDVEFHSGAVYRYAGVPADVHTQLLGLHLPASQQGDHSVGRAHGSLIKKAQYPYVKLPAEAK
jgi:hypothetical protein